MNPVDHKLRFLNDPYVRGSVILISALTLFRLWFATTFQLVGDEAYYWLWSKHLDICYFSKGPGVAWTIAAGTALFGDTVFGIRVFSILLAAGTGAGIALLAARLYSTRAAFWSLVIASLMPFFIVGGVLMTIDPLSVFFWTVAANLFWVAKDKRDLRWWGGVGLAVGFGMICKYTNIAQVACFAVFCLWCNRYRKHLWSLTFWTMVVVALLCLAPLVLWNARHDWVTFHHLLDRGQLDEPWRLSAESFLGFLGEQAVVAFPLFFIGLVVAFFRKESRQGTDLGFRYLASLILPLFIFYAILGLNDPGQPNWTAPCYVAGVILLAGTWLRMAERLKWARIAARASVALAVVAAIAVHLIVWFRLPIRRDPADRARGWTDLAGKVAAVQEELGADFVVGKDYGYASQLAFYLPGTPTTFTPTREGIHDQFSFWPGYAESGLEGKSALYVSDSGRVPDQLQREFRSVRLVKETHSMHRNQKVRKFYISFCDELRDSD